MRRTYRFNPSAADQLEGRVVLSKTTLGLSTVVSGLSPHLQALNRKQTALIAEVNQAFNSFQSDFDQARATYFASLQISPTSSSTSTSTSTSSTTSPLSQAATALLNAASSASSNNATTTALVNAANALVNAATTASTSTTTSSTPAPATVSAATTAFLDYTQQRTLLLAQQLVSSFVQTPQGTAKAPSQPYALKQLIETKIIGPKGRGPEGSLIQSLDETTSEMDSSVLSSSPTTSLYTLSQDNAIAGARTAVLNGVSIIKSGAFGIQKVSQY
jgi:hypothetical protein